MVRCNLDKQEDVFFVNLIWYITVYYVTVLLMVVAVGEFLPV